MGPLTLLLFVAFLTNRSKCDSTCGPDPWNNQVNLPDSTDDPSVPPDLRTPPKRKQPKKEGGVGISEWAYRRILALILKGSSVKKDTNNDAVITLSMQFPGYQMDTLNEYLYSNDVFSEDAYRRTLGYVEGAILKPSIGEKLADAWTDYLHFYIAEYQMHITWSFTAAAAVMTAFYLWSHISHKHICFIVFILIYLYEVFVSYKEAEQQEYDQFISAMNTCKWYFWSSSCTIPAPDPLVFIKHMHPLKIGLRIFSMLVTEPMLVVNRSVGTMVEGITGGLGCWWFPLDKILSCVLMVAINITLIIVLIMILFNFVLNIPIKLSFFAGLVSFGVQQRHRTFVNPTPGVGPISTNEGDRLSGQNVERLLEFCSQAMRRDIELRQEDKRNKPISFNKERSNKTSIIFKRKDVPLKKSSSTGRLSDLVHSHNKNSNGWFFNRPRQNKPKGINNSELGSGDAI